MPFVANIERCPKFLEYALHALIYSKKSYVCKGIDMKWHVGKLRSWVIITGPHVEWNIVYFYGCHSNGALKTTLSVLLDFSNPYMSSALL